MSKPYTHVVVLGGSAAGLFAARAISEHAERVTLIERDELPDAAEHRKGTPQSRHANNITARALPILDGWFPGFTDELSGEGAVTADHEVRAIVRGHRLARCSIGAPLVTLSRPLLDRVLRRRIRALGNVTIATGRDVDGLAFDGRAVVGARTRDHGTLGAELVIDALGRGSRARGALRDAGWPEPPATELQIGVRYSSWFFERKKGDVGGDKTLLVMPTRTIPRGGVALAIEGDRWLVTIFGYGVTPPTELAEARAYVRTLVADDLAPIFDRATPLGEAATFAYPVSRLRHLDRVAGPRGYIALGDSVAALNPCYGQGLTSAALQADAMAREAARGRDGFEARHHARAVAAASEPFELAWNADAELPGVVAPPNRTPAPIRAYMQRAMRAATTDPVVAAAVRRVINLLEPKQSLLRPSIAWRVLARAAA